MRLTVYIFCATLFATLGCSSTTEPSGEVVLTMQNISGVYNAATFTTESNGVLTSHIPLGGSIQLLLYGDGTTGGSLVMPADPASGLDLNESLAGSWTLEGNIVNLAHSSHTFLEDMDLAFAETHLTGETTRDSVIYRVVLGW